MSPSDTAAIADMPLAELIDAIQHRFSMLAEGTASDVIDLERMQRLMSLAIRTYTAAYAAAGKQVDPVTDEILTHRGHECRPEALLNHYDLNLFDMAAWTRRDPTPAAQGEPR